MKLNFDKVFILGMGVTGKSCLQFFCDYYRTEYNHQIEVICLDSKTLSCDDQKRKKVCFYLDHDAEVDLLLSKNDLIIWSPGISWEHRFLKLAIDLKVSIWSEIELASRFFTRPVYALTGTNGKTTTVSLIHHIFQKSNVKSFLGGNIGTPFIEAISKQREYDVAVLELSSFQLEAVFEFHPNVAGLLNIFENHEERYQYFDDYVLAKGHLLKKLTELDTFICRKKELSLLPYLKEKETKVKIKLIPSDLSYESPFWKGIDIKKFKLIGNHNLENLAMAIYFLREWGLSSSQIEKGMSSFKSVPFRLEEIYSNQYSIFNDSKSTNLNATLTALKSFEGTSLPILIMGGKLRSNGDRKGGSDVEIEEISKLVKYIISFGEAKEYIQRLFGPLINVIEIENLSSLVSLLEKNKDLSDKGLLLGHILFSPGFPSFDQYRNYLERGEHFNQIVVEYFMPSLV